MRFAPSGDPERAVLALDTSGLSERQVLKPSRSYKKDCFSDVRNIVPRGSRASVRKMPLGPPFLRPDSGWHVRCISIVLLEESVTDDEESMKKQVKAQRRIYERQTRKFPLRPGRPASHVRGARSQVVLAFGWHSEGNPDLTDPKEADCMAVNHGSCLFPNRTIVFRTFEIPSPIAGVASKPLVAGNQGLLHREGGWHDRCITQNCMRKCIQQKQEEPRDKRRGSPREWPKGFQDL